MKGTKVALAVSVFVALGISSPAASETKCPTENEVNPKILETIECLVNEKVDEKLKNVTPLRIESGVIDLHHSDSPDLRRTDQCPSERGHIDKRIEFSTPFKKPPEVVLSLNLLDHVIDGGLANNLRIRADVVAIDTHGFDYNLNTWCNTDIWAVRASWIAYGQ